MYGPLLEALENGSEIVTANNRLARNIKHVVNRSRLAAGDMAWPTPAVFSWNAWLHRLWEDVRVSGDAAHDLRLISDSQSTVIWEQIITESGLFERESVRGAAVAAAAWRLVANWAVADAPEWTGAGLSPDQQMFLRWSGEYRDRCRQLGCLDMASLPAKLTEYAEAGALDHLKPLVFAGFDSWAPTAVRLREALNARRVGVSLSAGPEQQNTAGRFSCDSDRAELETAARWARKRIESNPHASVAVVVRDHDARAAEVRRVFMDVFCPDWRTRAVTELPVNFSYGEPLINRPRVAAALNILRLTLPDTDYRCFSLVLRTPFLDGGREEAGARAALDLRLRDKLGAYFGPGEALPVAKHIAPGFRRLLELLSDPGREKHTAREWARWITDLLRRLGWPGDEALDSIAWQELDSWNSLLQEFASTDGLRDNLSWSQAFSLLERLARNRLYQPDTGEGLIQVMGMLEASGHEFDHLWVTGLNAEDWPEARLPNPLLPALLQRRAGMPGGDPGTDLDYAIRLTERLQSSAAEVVFSWPARRDGELLRPSELIAGIEELTVVDRWDAELWALSIAGTASPEQLTDDVPAAWEPGRKARGGARLFNLQAQCPMRAFFELRLGAAEVERPLIGIGFRERGSLAHDVLEEFYGRYSGAADIRGIDSVRLENELSALVKDRLHQLPGMGRHYLRAIADLEINRLVPLLVEFVQLDAERDAFRVLEREQKRDVEIGPVALEVRLDRMDELPDGSRLVIDYKTGSVSRRSWNPRAPRDMQLPLYATYTDPGIKGVAFAQLAAGGVGYEGIAADEVGFVGITTPEAMARSRFKDADGNAITTWEELTQAWQQTLLELADDFAAGNCRVNPNRTELADGQFAVLTRINEMIRNDDGDDNG